jgi:BirA family biotin operon repressor/biotin-[acetyl-CoA-carboxylase] ligase
MGEAIRVRLGDRTLEGTFSDLDRDGALLLADPDGRIRRIEAGEVLLAAG